MNGAITFDDATQWDAELAALLFFAHDGDNRILCVLPAFSVQSRYGHDPNFQKFDRKKACEDVYENRREEIKNEFRQLISSGQVDDENRVTLQAV